MATIDQLDLKEGSWFARVHVTSKDGRPRNPLYVSIDTPDSDIRVDLETVLSVDDERIRVHRIASTDSSALVGLVGPHPSIRLSEKAILTAPNFMRATRLDSGGGEVGFTSRSRDLDPIGIVQFHGDRGMEDALMRVGLGNVAFYNLGFLRFHGLTRIHTGLQVPRPAGYSQQ